MPETETERPEHDIVPPPRPAVLARAGVGGVLMGLANLVPGISGGTMLLATGIYPAFIESIAEVTTFRLRVRSLAILGVVAGAAVVAIGSLAGATKSLVVEHRWIMYSLFIGLTLGGVPLVWRLARPASRGVVAGGCAAFAVMVAMATLSPAGAGSGPNPLLLLLSGVAGAGAMILPGVSGGYLLLLLGQYVPILGAIDGLKLGLVDGLAAVRAGELGVGELLTAPALAPAREALGVVIPVAIGVVVGVVGVSNLLGWLLQHYEKPTLGALLGLLLGAIVGLWPFQEGVPPQAGDRIKGRVLTVETAAEVEPDDWKVAFFRPSGAQLASAVALIGVGLGATLLIGRLGRETDPHAEAA